MATVGNRVARQAFLKAKTVQNSTQVKISLQDKVLNQPFVDYYCVLFSRYILSFVNFQGQTSFVQYYFLCDYIYLMLKDISRCL